MGGKRGTWTQYGEKVRRKPPRPGMCGTCKVRPHRLNKRMCEHCAAWHRINSRSRKKPTPEQRRKFRLKARYNVTPAQFDEILAKQGGKCPICLGDSPKHLDHNHVSGEIRGILHGPCNQLLGLAKESIEILKGAISYLESYQTK